MATVQACRLATVAWLTMLWSYEGGVPFSSRNHHTTTPHTLQALEEEEEESAPEVPAPPAGPCVYRCGQCKEKCFRTKPGHRNHNCYKHHRMRWQNDHHGRGTCVLLQEHIKHTHIYIYIYIWHVRTCPSWWSCSTARLALLCGCSKSSCIGSCATAMPQA